ncbi:MAG TPA: hypothetical protein VFX96_01495 [Pyrinomonadaceae bacterium]|nr:hypothetical protein [Pyrinomonadaceae bacterium]
MDKKKRIILAAALVVVGVGSMWARYASEEAARRKREALFRSLSTYTSRPAALDSTVSTTPDQPADTRDTFDAGLLDETFGLIKQAVGQEFKLLDLSISELGFTVNVSTDGQNVQLYRRPKGRKNLEGPSKVQMLGDGDLTHSLYDPSEANLALVPKLVEEAKERAELPDSRASSATFTYALMRYKGESPEWTISVEGGEGESRQSKSVVFDAKGKFKKVF